MRDVDRGRRSTVGRHLGWLLLQGTFLLPMAFTGLREFSAYPWSVKAAALVATGWVAYCLVRNVVCLWRAPGSEANAGSVLRLGAVAAWFTVIALGPLLEGHGTSQPLGAVAALLAVSLWVLAGRDAVRMGRRPRSTPLLPT